MNREIKFRGKRNGFSKWLYFDMGHHLSDITDMPPDFLQYPLDLDTVGQYTGRRDKNGKEVYDGDMVRSGNGRIWEIRFGKYTYYTDSPALGFYMYSASGNFPLGFDNNEIEIIGNIHDNPELLENE